MVEGSITWSGQKLLSYNIRSMDNLSPPCKMNKKYRTRETTGRLKCLSCKQKDWVWIPRTHENVWWEWQLNCNSSLGRNWGCWSKVARKTNHTGIWWEDPTLKNRWRSHWGRFLKSASELHMHVPRTPTYIHPHIYRHTSLPPTKH